MTDSRVPFECIDGVGRVFGYPTDPSWWGQLPAEEQGALCDGRRGPEAAYAAMVVAAVEELRGLVGRWKQEHWADVGGANGHYCVALRALGIEQVTLVEPTAQLDVPQAVLDGAGVRVIQERAQDVELPTAGVAVRLYVPEVGFEVLRGCVPNVRMLVYDDTLEIERIVHADDRWRVRDVRHESRRFLLGEGSVIPSPTTRRQPPRLVAAVGSVGLSTARLGPRWAPPTPVDSTAVVHSFTDDDIPF